MMQGSKIQYRPLLKKLLIVLSVILLWNALYIFPHSLNDDGQRQTSVFYENEVPNCKWTPPNYNIPEDENWYKTLVVGYPSGDKRLVFMQMEGLTGWATKDEWAFKYVSMTNHPFIKANYPHHDGIWGWGDVGDQVVLVVQNIRKSLVEFHDIMMDLGFVNTYPDALKAEGNLYSKIPSKEIFLEWRDVRLLDEIHWYSFFTDYYMEGGLLRDVLTHKTTTLEHFTQLMNPGTTPRQQLTWDYVVGNETIVIDTIDPMCSKVTEGCHPVTIISTELLLDTIAGPVETHKIGETLKGKPRISDFLIDERAWSCIWEELIVNRKGEKTFLDRPGYADRNYNFSEEMLNAMISELDRLIEKYSAPEWYGSKTAEDLVFLMRNHKEAVQKEVVEVQTGIRVLRDDDFLGPETRRKRRIAQLKLEGGAEAPRELKMGHEEYSEYFAKLDQEFYEKKKSHMKHEGIKDDQERRRKAV